MVFSAGKYHGEIRREFHCDEMLDALSRLPELLNEPDAELIAGGRNQNIRVALPSPRGTIAVMVKRFGTQSPIKDWLDTRFRQTKAMRSYQAALRLIQHEVGTPAPIAYLEMRQGSRLRESYFLTVYENGLTGFNEVLLYLLHHQASCSRLMPVLQEVARLCRAMHDAGFIHSDLGNQNILLSGDATSGYHSAKIIDLNRGRVSDELSLQQRGKDLVRLNIPSNIKLMFLDMYWGGPSPDALLSAHRLHSSLFAMRVGTRKLRHPIREARIAREESGLPADRIMPSARDHWLWDDYSDQPLAVIDRRERSRNYPRGRGLRLLRDLLLAGPAIWMVYRRYRQSAFAAPVEMKKRIGIALAPSEATLAAEMELLDRLGHVPVLLRIACQDSPEQRDFQVQLIRALSAKGYPVKLALLQNRMAVRFPRLWEEFVLRVLEQVAGLIDSVEFGHAINRVKWGVWDFQELRDFYGVLPVVQSRYPDLKISGPATIDFEYPFMLSALKLWPSQVRLATVSHHLYVDRRGAPENLQNGFSALEKFALAKAFAVASPAHSDLVEVTEVNWPVKGTGIHSPVTPPFEYPQDSHSKQFDSGVSESNAADYMLRYLVLATGSGLVERVYWWRLLARGYGLVDIDQDGALRERPAFAALQHFLSVLGSAKVIQGSLPAAGNNYRGIFQIHFQCADKEEVVLCWAHGDAIQFPNNIRHAYLQDRTGKTISEPPVELTGSPVYFRQVTATSRD